jgi:enoyl-CoA hydratase/carnithine racemase
MQMRRDGEITVVTVDNPPINGLKHEVRAGILDAFTRANDDASAKAIVLADVTLDTFLQSAANHDKLADEGRGFASLADAAKKSA